MTTSPAQLALAEFTRRRVLAADLVRQGRWSEGKADAMLAPWAAVALMAGADLPPLREALAEMAARTATSWPDLPRGRLDLLARARLADDLGHLAGISWRTALIEARNKALDRFTKPDPVGEPETEVAIRLVTLCNHFALPGWRPASMVEAMKEAA